VATAGDQINAALRLIGVLAEGEQPSAATLSDAITAFNQMLDSWSTERLSVFCTIDNTVTWPSGQASQTIGPSGDFAVNPCPLEIDDATYYAISNISYPLTFINEAQYNSVTLKSSTSTLPQVMYSEKVPGLSDNQIRMTLWPVPTQDIELHVISVSQLDQIVDETTTLVYPPGYLRAVKYNLAVELAPEFGVEASRTVKKIAQDSKRNIKRINNPGDVMSMPGGLLGVPRFNIFAGY
jgi:hypothetical protein